MTDNEIREGLKLLGVNEDSYRALALLPLVQVAWADGTIQSKERQIILKVANDNGYLDGAGKALLEGWLKRPPKAPYYERARRLLIAMVHHEEGIVGHDLTIDALTDLVDYCELIARSAGGFFGIFPMDVREKAAITEICDAISLPPRDTLDLDTWKILAPKDKR